MGSLNLNLGAPRFSGSSRTGEVVAYCSYLVLLLSLTMVVSSYLVLQLIHLAWLVRVGGIFP